MKRILVSLIGVAMMAVVAIPVSAQKGTKSVGAQVVLGSGDGLSNIGLGAKFRYNVSNPIRLEGAFTYFFEKDLVSMWDLSVNAHYLFHVAPRLTLYPLAGLGIMGVTVDVPKVNLGGGIGTIGGRHSDSEFGFNIGGGADYMLNQQWGLNAEVKFRVGGDWNRTLISLGATYAF